MNHLWIYLTIASAFSGAMCDTILKGSVNKDNEILIMTFQFLMALPFLYIVGFILWYKGLSGEIFRLSQLDSKFYIAFFMGLPLEVAATILYVKALRISPINLTLPFLSLTPMFLILFSWLILGEKVSIKSGIGIFLITLGSYLLNIKDITKGFFEPFKAIAKERGSLYMIIISILYSFTSVFGKMGVTHSTPLFFGVIYVTALVICLIPFTIYSCRVSKIKIVTKRNLKIGLILGFIAAFSNIMHYAALGISNVSYMIAIKRLGPLFTIILGYFFFKEAGFKERFTGALIMFAGFVLIVTSSF
ncbi:MAG: EamA family transporter [Nitrospirae bacterium]|nr:EamA family transporter [Nitrospirota bacterium]MBF0541612.1 EamA family transporter [Nitrospirota bacterium]